MPIEHHSPPLAKLRAIQRLVSFDAAAEVRSATGALVMRDLRGRLVIDSPAFLAHPEAVVDIFVISGKVVGIESAELEEQTSGSRQ
jgi:hypothetical protein